MKIVHSVERTTFKMLAPWWLPTAAWPVINSVPEPEATAAKTMLAVILSIVEKIKDNVFLEPEQFYLSKEFWGQLVY